MKRYKNSALPLDSKMLQTAKDYLCTLMHDIVERMRGFSLLDFFVLESCLLSLGLFIGTHLSKWLKKCRVFIFFGFIVSYIYLIWRVFLRDDCD